jgi:ABC-type transport system involved in cytochrome c biogenesis permease subunit
MWHGIAAMVATMALGSIFPFHLKAGLKSRRKLWSGLSQLAFLSALLLTGVLLYYGPEVIRDAVITSHWVIGITFFAIFLLHGVFAKKCER